jgi:hypothetical protein
MSKPKNRNAERIKNGKQPHNICKTAKNKPFIGNNVFTTEDIDIVKRFTETYPDDWTLQEIKDILPNTHTLKNVSNFLLRMFPQQVIDEHAAMPQPVRETAEPKSKPNTKPTKEELARMRIDCWVQQLFPYLGPSYTNYPDIMRKYTGLEVSNDEVIAHAAKLGVSYIEPIWTTTEDELLIDCKDDLLTDGNADWHIYTDTFDTKRSKYQVINRISLLEQALLTPEDEQTDDTIDDTTTEKEDDAMNNNTNTDTTVTDSEKNREDFRKLSDILMSLSPDVTLHIDIKFPDGMAIRFDREAKGGN